VKKSESKYDGILSLAGGLAKKVISPVDPEFIKKGILQVWDLKSISKDLVDSLVARALKQKDEIIEVMANEFSKFLQRIDVSEELKNMMNDLSIHVDATIELKRRSTGKSAGKFSNAFQIQKPSGKKSRKK
jgi:hypothetical protein